MGKEKAFEDADRLVKEVDWVSKSAVIARQTLRQATVCIEQLKAEPTEAFRQETAEKLGIASTCISDLIEIAEDALSITDSAVEEIRALVI